MVVVLGQQLIVEEVAEEVHLWQCLLVLLLGSKSRLRLVQVV